MKKISGSLKCPASSFKPMCEQIFFAGVTLLNEAKGCRVKRLSCLCRGGNHSKNTEGAEVSSSGLQWFVYLCLRMWQESSVFWKSGRVK